MKYIKQLLLFLLAILRALLYGDREAVRADPNAPCGNSPVVRPG